MTIPHSPHSIWPMTHFSADPWAADEWLDDPSDFKDYKRWGSGALDKAAYTAQDQAFLQAYRAILSGEDRLSATSLHAHAQALDVPTQRTHDWREPQVVPRSMPDLRIAQMAEDLVPDAPLLAERWLGPYALDASRPLMTIAVAGTCLFNTLANDSSPAVRFRNARPRPDLHDRQGLGALMMAPAMLWDAQWRPLLPLYESWLPTGPVVADPVPLSGAPGPYTLARLVPTEDGSWHANMAISLRQAPPPSWLERRLHLELLRLRRHDRRANWETMLRQRGEVLYRSCAVWSWMKEMR